MPRKSAVIEAFNRFPIGYYLSEPTRPHEGRSGDVTIAELIAILESSATHCFSVPSPHFGLVDIPIADAVRRLRDEYFVRRVEQFLEKYPEAKANISIRPAYVRKRYGRNGYTDEAKNPRPIKYAVSFRWFGYSDGETIFTMRD
jgi:hypothetical protein